MEKDSMFMDRKTQYCQDISSSQHDSTQFSVEIPESYFVDIDKLSLKFIRKGKRPRTASTILKEKNR